MAGYSGTSLAKKLGIKPGLKVVLLNAPADADLPGVEGAKSGVGDVTLLFSRSARDLGKLVGLRKVMPQAGCVWACRRGKGEGQGRGTLQVATAYEVRGAADSRPLPTIILAGRCSAAVASIWKSHLWRQEHRRADCSRRTEPRSGGTP
jgi:hypothetical protein